MFTALWKLYFTGLEFFRSSSEMNEGHFWTYKRVRLWPDLSSPQCEIKGQMIKPVWNVRGPRSSRGENHEMVSPPGWPSFWFLLFSLSPLCPFTSSPLSDSCFLGSLLPSVDSQTRPHQCEFTFLYHQVATQRCLRPTSTLSPMCQTTIKRSGDQNRRWSWPEDCCQFIHKTPNSGSWEQVVVPQDQIIALEKLSVSSFLLSGCIFVILCDFVTSRWNCRFFEKNAGRAGRTVGVYRICFYICFITAKHLSRMNPGETCHCSSSPSRLHTETWPASLKTPRVQISHHANLLLSSPWVIIVCLASSLESALS